jgi:hypothetical protein
MLDSGGRAVLDGGDRCVYLEGLGNRAATAFAEKVRAQAANENVKILQFATVGHSVTSQGRMRTR